MVADIEPDIIDITESWAHKDMVDAELMLTGYVMFRKDRQERMGGRVIMYIKDSIQAYELQMENDSKSFYIYVRSKQKVRNKVGPLKNITGTVISDGFQMAEDLNEYFSSVFTKEDISSLPLPARKFEGDESQNLGQLFVTPEMI